MSLSPGTRLGPYEIVTPLGAGGMGEVYRARDTRLHREVAVKVLPASFSQDADRLRRFEQEARAASALNHPNIVTIHDFGSEGAAPYVVSELLEGETLRERLAGGRLPVRKALDYAAQIARGLAAAHEKGIVHRDLKPENLFVTKDGRVKILDFGLAKLTHPERGAVPLTEAPTQTLGTEPGLVMGTVGYMSPEQALGSQIDFRSDQFSFGSILYEMVTGRRAFQRKTTPETLAAIIRDDPEPIAKVDSATPSALGWITERCLTKESRERYASTEDLARDIEGLNLHLSEASRPLPASEGKPRRYRASRLVVAGLVLTAAILSFLAGERKARVRLPVFHRLTFRRGYIWSARFAPDGQTIIYGSAWDGDPVQLFSMRPESPESLRLQIPSADVLSVSSSGEMAILLGRRFVENWLSIGTLAQLSLSASAPREIAQDVLGADWSPGGKSLAIVRDVRGSIRLEFPVGKVLYETVGWISDPRVSPTGDLVAFLDHPIRGDDGGSVVTVDRLGRKSVLSGGWLTVQGVAWSGSEIWFTASNEGFSRDLYAINASGKVRAIARIGDNLRIQDISREGRVLLTRDHVRAVLIGLPPGEKNERDLSWLDLSIAIDLSPDGSQLLFSDGGATRSAIYVRKTDGSSPPVRLGDGWTTGLSPDGRWALVPDLRLPQLLLLPTGADDPKRLDTSPVTEIGWASFLPGGNGVLLAGNERGRGVRLYVKELGRPRPITEEGINAVFGAMAVSPDGKVVAAIGPGQRVFLYPIEGGPRSLVPGLQSGDVPLQWSIDGQSLYVFKRGELPARVFRLNLSTGRKEGWKELMPSDRAGVNLILTIRLTPDAKSYAYSYGQVLSELEVVEGLK